MYRKYKPRKGDLPARIAHLINLRGMCCSGPAEDLYKQCVQWWKDELKLREKQEHQKEAKEKQARNKKVKDLRNIHRADRLKDIFDGAIKSAKDVGEKEVPMCCHVCKYEKTHGDLKTHTGVWFECGLTGAKLNPKGMCPPKNCPLRKFYNDYEDKCG